MERVSSSRSDGGVGGRFYGHFNIGNFWNMGKLGRLKKGGLKKCM
jgi:hypothetical protein